MSWHSWHQSKHVSSLVTPSSLLKSTTHFNLPALSIGLSCPVSRKLYMLSKLRIPAGCKADGNSRFRMLTNSYLDPHHDETQVCLCRNQSLATWLTAFLTATLSIEEVPQPARYSEMAFFKRTKKKVTSGSNRIPGSTRYSNQ